jgi:hypothetical protein
MPIVLPHVVLLAVFKIDFAALPPRQIAPSREMTALSASPTGSGATGVCIEGRAVAEFYLVGFQKCATSTLSLVLMDAGMSLPYEYQGMIPAKESHIVDVVCQDASPGYRYPVSCAGVSGASMESQRAFSNRSTFACGEGNASFSTIADFTPGYASILELPRFLAELYGQSARRLSLVFMLREPISRMRSQVYFEAYGPWNATYGIGMGYHEGTITNFSSYVTMLQQTFPAADHAALAANFSTIFVEQGDIFDPMMRSAYGLWMAPYFSAFDASQFVVLPMMWAMNHTRSAVELLAAHFPHLTIDPTLAPETGSTDNKNHQADAEDEEAPLSPSKTAWLESRFWAPDLLLLSNLLATAACHGAAIGGLNAPSADLCPEHGGASASAAAAVAAHLRSSW